MKTYIVQGWLNGSDYDAGKPAGKVVTVRAADESDADTKGDKKIKKEFQTCDVVISTLAE